MTFKIGDMVHAVVDGVETYGRVTSIGYEIGYVEYQLRLGRKRYAWVPASAVTQMHERNDRSYEQ